MTVKPGNNLVSVDRKPVDLGMDPRLEPPRVHRAADKQDHWVVTPPREATNVSGSTIFTGSRAQHHALVYAHETFGCARFFPY